MGFIRDGKVAAMVKYAKEAREREQKVFFATFAFPKTQPGMSLEVTDWSLMVEAIEEEGWALDKMTGLHLGQHDGLGLLFRR